jgi:beta-galactosidase
MPDLPSLNNLSARASLLLFATADTALTLDPAQSLWVQTLNGYWDFKIFPQPEAISHNTISQGIEISINVPGNWTMQGFGRPHYTNVLLRQRVLLPV